MNNDKLGLAPDMQAWRKQTADAAAFLVMVIDSNNLVPKMLRKIAIRSIETIVGELLS